jgi:UDP-2,3-diacylglucosamine pyrophosphatase LpxH
MSDDSVTFLYGDDYGVIDDEVLGTHNGTTTRRCSMSKQLARELYDELQDVLDSATETYLVYGFDDKRIGNVTLVEATSEWEALEIVEDSGAAWLGYRQTVRNVDEYPERGDVWSAKY